MSNRLDRSLGVKPYSQRGGRPAPKKRWSLKATTVIWYFIFIIAAAGAIHVLSQTAACSSLVRCAD